MIKIENPLPFHKFHEKMANIDATKEALNCTASLQLLTVLLTPLVSSGSMFCDPKTSSRHIRIRLQGWPD